MDDFAFDKTRAEPAPASSRRWGLAKAQAILLQLPAYLLVLMATWYLGLYAFLAWHRLQYPYDIEWMEGGVLEHVMRVIEGKPLYVAPTLEFTPFIYAPLYYLVCAPFVMLLGPSLPALRIVSVLSSFGVFWFLYATVHVRTRSRLAGFVSAGMFAACFEIAGSWFDVARVDSLSLCLVMLGVWLLMRDDRRDVWAGVAFALAMFAKQSAVITVAPLLGACFLARSGVRRLYAGVSFGVIAVGLAVLMNQLSHGWYRYYVFELPSQHPWMPGLRWGFWRDEMFPRMPLACAAALYACFAPAPWRARLFTLAAALGFAATGWIARMHTGSYLNVNSPTLLFLAWSAGEALAVFTRPAQEADSQGAADAPRSPPSSPSAFAIALCLVQLALLYYDPRPHLPREADTKAGDALVAYLKKAKGTILSPHDPSLARLAGRVGSGHDQAFNDVYLGSDQRKNTSLSNDIRVALKTKRYGVVVLSRGWWERELHASYRRVYDAPLPIGSALFTRTGWRGRPLEIWIRR